MLSDLGGNDHVSAISTSNHIILFADMSHLQWKASAAFPYMFCEAPYFSPLWLVPEGTS